MNCICTLSVNSAVCFTAAADIKADWWTSYTWVTWSQLRYDAVEETHHFSHYQNEYTQCCFSTINLIIEKPSYSRPNAAAEYQTSSKLLPILDSIQIPLQGVLCWKSTTEVEQTSVQEKKTNWRFCPGSATRRGCKLHLHFHWTVLSICDNSWGY